ncbi:hypothetical protein R1sor_023635 [Riccia sorocarpa]|uniref:THIF-type NAD/FAD binding fold domain-containing protein n=1 Tax=Riccia sorocarpa TaxID=122646 RepID=A0ABD3GSB6_9MARC
MPDVRFSNDIWKPAVLFATFASVSLLTTFLASRRNRRKRGAERFTNRHTAGPFFGAVPNGFHDPQQDEIQRTGSLDSSPDLDFITDDITSEQFTRNTQFYGEEGQKKVHEAMVIVIGLGGVGSHAATMLLRAGIAKLRLIDFDQVSLSSLNRHAVATRADVGTPKALCLQKHFKEIFPECEVDARVQMFDSSTAEDILSGCPDFVLDCIDNIDTKIALLAECARRGLKVLSATGAGARADPTRIRIADISESSVDPLSRSVRHRLRRDYNITSGIPVVISTERPKAKLLPFSPPDGKEGNPLDYQVVPGFRVRTIPVLGTIPAIFGQVMASYVITSIAEMAVVTEPVVNLSVDHYALLHQRLIEREELLFGTASEVELDKEEVAVIIREIWRGRSARDQGSREGGRGMWNAMKMLTLTRWDVTKPPTIGNLVLLTFSEAEEHEATPLHILKKEEPEFYNMVEKRLSFARKEFDC